MTGLPPHRRPVNTMFQSYALFPHMSVAANIGFGLRQRGASRAETQQRVAAMLALVRLEGFGARRPGELSGGQQQRVALARSLAPTRRCCCWMSRCRRSTRRCGWTRGRSWCGCGANSASVSFW